MNQQNTVIQQHIQTKCSEMWKSVVDQVQEQATVFVKERAHLPYDPNPVEMPFKLKTAATAARRWGKRNKRNEKELCR